MSLVPRILLVCKVSSHANNPVAGTVLQAPLTWVPQLHDYMSKLWARLCSGSAAAETCSIPTAALPGTTTGSPSAAAKWDSAAMEESKRNDLHCWALVSAVLRAPGALCKGFAIATAGVLGSNPAAAAGPDAATELWPTGEPPAPAALPACLHCSHNGGEAGSWQPTASSRISRTRPSLPKAGSD